MPNAFALHEIICDKGGKPYDYRFLEVNRAFEEMTRLSADDIIGKTVLEILPETESCWIENYGKVALTGEPTRLEKYSSEISEYFEVYAFSPEIGRFATVFTSITERREAVAALQQSEKRYRELVEGVPGLIYSYSTTSGGIFYSPNVQSVLGYTPSQLLQNPQLWHDSIHPEDLTQVDTVIDEFMVGKEFEIEYRIADANGKWHWFLDKSIGRRQEHGEIIIDGIATDITDRKNTEEAVQEERFKLKEYFEYLPVAAYNVTFDGIIADCNPKAVRTLECNGKEELVGKPVISTLYAPSSQETAKQIFEKWKKTHKIENHELQILTKKGKTIDILLNIETVRDMHGNPQFSLSTHIDITDRNKYKKALRESNKRLSEIVEGTEDLITSVDAVGRFTYVNHAAEKIFGVSKEECIGLSAFEFVHPDDREQTVNWFFEKIDQLVQSGQIENRQFNQKTGETHYMLWTSNFYYDDKGNIKGVNGIARNLTERKKAEMALQKSHDELEHIVKARTAELEQQTRHLAETNAALSVLLEKREQDKHKLAHDVVQNVQDLIQPILENLKNSHLNSHQQGYLETLETFLNEIVSPFTGTLKSQYRLLTPTEVRVANLIKQGKTTKEIAQLLNMAETTAKHHRRGIRKKLGITYQKVNLASHLASLSE